MSDTLLNIFALIIVGGLMLMVLCLAIMYFRIFVYCIYFKFMKLFFRSKVQGREDPGFGHLIMSFTISFTFFVISAFGIYSLIKEGITMEELSNVDFKRYRNH